MIRNTPSSITRFVADKVRQKRGEEVRDFRTVRVRRPHGWSRADFRDYLVLGQQRGHWTWSLVCGEDVAVLVAGDALLDLSEEAAS
jgi:hypothetical protein